MLYLCLEVSQYNLSFDRPEMRDFQASQLLDDLMGGDALWGLS